MQDNIEIILKNAKKMDVPDSTLIKVDNALRDLEHQEEKASGKPRLKKLPVIAAAAAVICLLVLGGMFLLPQSESDNIFSLKAYAMEQLDDGSIELREVDLLDQTHSWSFADDGENVYIKIWLKCEGENIKNVEFYTDEGFFAKQYIERENGQIVRESVPMAGIGRADGTQTIIRFGNDYEITGNTLMLSAEEMTDDLLLFWGRESRRIGDDLNLPRELTFRAVATFNDGKTQEEMVTIDLSKPFEGLGIVQLTDEESEQMRFESIRRQNLLHNIPLAQCEVVPGSEVILSFGDTFEYRVDDSGYFASVRGTGIFPITEEAMDPANDWSLKRDGFPGLFDKNGTARFDSGLFAVISAWDEYDGSNDGYISTLENNGDGTFTGKTYKVPGQLILEKMK